MKIFLQYLIILAGVFLISSPITGIISALLEKRISGQVLYGKNFKKNRSSTLQISCILSSLIVLLVAKWSGILNPDVFNYQILIGSIIISIFLCIPIFTFSYRDSIMRETRKISNDSRNDLLKKGE